MRENVFARRRKLFSLAAKQIGFVNALRFMALKYRNKRSGSKKNASLSSPQSKTPLAVRPDTSDIAVFQQIFVELEYGCLDFLSAPDWIIDCGANVGYSSAYFLSRFPKARVIAIEPDAGNYQMLVQNTAFFGERITPINAGVWSHEARLRVRQAEVGAGKEWAFFVEEAAPGEPCDVEAVNLDSVLAQAGAAKIDLLKVDIEGAEKVVFADGAAAWLKTVAAVVIELHGPECERIVTEALAPRAKERFQHGELTIYRLSV